MMKKTASKTDLRERLNNNRENMFSSQASIDPSQKKPKLCKVCDRASFLKCMECDTIYCSSKCQIKDWENHQYLHSTKSQSNTKSRAKHISVQGRLLNLKEPMKVDIDDQLLKLDNVARQMVKTEANQMEVDEIASNLGAVALQDQPHPLGKQETVIDQTLRKILICRKFKRHVTMPEGEFGHVYITEVQENIDGSKDYWVMPMNLLESFKMYKQALNETYSKDDVPSIGIEDIAKFQSHLVMAKIEDNWVRASILQILTADKVVGLEDIDTGKRTIAVLPKDAVKVAKESEMMKSAYAFKVQFENIDSGIDIDIVANDIIEIRVTTWNPFGVNLAEVKLESGVEVDMDVVDKKEDLERLFIDAIHVKHLPVGPKVKVQFCDGSKLDKGKMQVCESKKENWDFYNAMAARIEEFIKKNPKAGGYKPVVRELVLAKFTDGCFYRGCCLDASHLDAKISFFDYGSVNVCGHASVVPLPRDFLQTACSHLVDVKLASGRPISDIDFDETRGLLAEKNEFFAKVDEITPLRYAITLDDSLVVFKA